MDKALKVYSAEHGYFIDVVRATEIKSHAHARKLSPFVDDTHRLVYWVNWGAKKENGKPRVAHFRHYPQNSQKGLRQHVAKDIERRFSVSLESAKHRKAKDEIYCLLVDLLAKEEHLPWAFKDPEISDFSMSGDLLAGAISVEKEYRIKTPFGPDYRLDIAILGRTIGKKPIVLAGLEIEFTHRFDFIKALLCKTIGFPLISIDITETNESQINATWAKMALIETTNNSVDGLRRNYIYIHRFLSTVFIDIPRDLVPEARHQYVIFTSAHERLLHFLRKLKSKLELSDKQVMISPISNKNKQLQAQIDNAGCLAGDSWRDHNENTYIQLTIDKPPNKSGNLYYYHLVLAKLCNSDIDCLVGYKYDLGYIHRTGDSLIWKRGKKAGDNWKQYNVAPKRLSEPVLQILRHIEK